MIVLPFHPDYAGRLTWSELRTQVESERNQSLVTLLQSVAHNPSLDTSGLEAFLQLDSCDDQRVSVMMHRISSSLLSLTDLFPDGILPQVSQSEPSRLSLFQVWAIMALMTLCILPPVERASVASSKTDYAVPDFIRDDNVWKELPLTDLTQWFRGPLTSATNLYLQAWLEYWNSFDAINNSKICFHLCSATPCTINEMIQCNVPICRLDVVLEPLDQGLNAFDSQELVVDVDFANRCVSLGRTASQEEVLLGTRPPACIVGLVLGAPLSESETLLITTEQNELCPVVHYDGIGSNIRFSRSRQRSNECHWIMAMDALEMDVAIQAAERQYELFERKNRLRQSQGLELLIADSLLDPVLMPDCDPSDEQIYYQRRRLFQLQPAVLDRELNKAYCGYVNTLRLSHHENVTLAGGYWGCSLFGGDRSIKALIQWIAASLALNQRAGCLRFVALPRFDGDFFGLRCSNSWAITQSVRLVIYVDSCWIFVTF